ncbi:MAG: orotate phosphoribosyltransferase [Proteobacteria bacterium]|nr:orotate phosphoribosyltransferase [Pseudomonadota bacterium]
MTKINKNQALIKLLKEKSVRFGEFTLASGKKSDFYVDARQCTLNAQGALLIADLILEVLKPDVVAVGGPVTGADPIAGAVALRSALSGRNIHGFMVRKEPKGHGAQHWIEGLNNIPKGSSLCIVEDTVTTGGSLLKAVEKCEQAGFKIAQCITVVDREEGARSKIEASGYEYRALITRTDLMD